MKLIQEPPAGVTILRYEGDVLHISLQTEQKRGRAFLRTNFGRAEATRREVIESVERETPVQGCSWYDMPLAQKDGVYSIDLPLTEVGIFDFKACFVPEDGIRHWVEGNNLRVKVEPALLWADNTIYNAFIRQFGPNKSGQFYNEEMRHAEEMLRNMGYTVQPPAGVFDDVWQQLGHIMGRLGFRIVMFLPVHPVTASFSRMGRFGSPFAPMNFRIVDMSMAVFDRRTTPVEQFCRLVDGIHARGGLALLDMPFDHTGWASAMQVSHPEWFCRNGDGTFESPGAWGVVWADLCKLDFSKKSLWRELAEIALHWCRLGIDGFRCDAGYMVPLPVWRYITAKVREQFPDTLFFLEGLGGSLDITRALLADGGLDWAYSESFQQYGYDAENGYLDYTLDSARHNGVLVNFAETHDNSRLAAKSSDWARLRVASAALLAPAGAFGMANGVEWLATEKIDVHGDASLNWGSDQNIIEQISAIMGLLKSHPAFAAGAELRKLQTVQGRALALLRRSGENEVLVVINPDLGHGVSLSWSAEEFNPGESAVDLLKSESVELHISNGRVILELLPGRCLCLSESPWSGDGDHFAAVRQQQLRAMALHIMQHDGRTDYENLPAMAEAIGEGWQQFLSDYRRNDKDGALFTWVPTRDARRRIVVSRDVALIVLERSPFIVELFQNGKCLEHRRAVLCKDGIWMAILTNVGCCGFEHERQSAVLQLKAHVYSDADGAAVVCQGDMQVIETSQTMKVQLCREAQNIADWDMGLCSNICGSYTMARAAWGGLCSKYDGLLVANYTERYPDERFAMLIRVRAWLFWNDFSYELALPEQSSFLVSYDNALQWNFQVPCGPGWKACISAVWKLDKEHNAGTLYFTMKRLIGCQNAQVEGMRLIVRPDVDCRSQHSVTKAYAGAEQRYPASVTATEKGFLFCGDGVHCLQLKCTGVYHTASEWCYNVPLPVEQERGLDSAMDIFSPGYFECAVAPGSCITLDASAFLAQSEPQWCNQRKVTFARSLPLDEALRRSLRYFYAQRISGKESHATLMAGYPWFLDWGRDTLICLRGFIAAGELDIARDVICQFAQFELNGTLPNMIRGNDTSDRDTSDAPLWLFICVGDYIEADCGSREILQMECGGRRLGDILLQLADSLWKGAQNGVRVDVKSGLLFSRAHFTWMDTNYPAGTPRTGYPVEIEALWIGAMDVLNRYLKNSCWRERADLARSSFIRLFRRQDGMGLVDCRHCDDFMAAESAAADDAVRPNQLLAITLGIVDDVELCDGILFATSALLIPGGIRSLDDREVTYHLPVSDNGRLLNNPAFPYWGHYSGDENTRRKPAYHNGTAWGWQMPMFCEALARLHTVNADMAMAWLASAADVMSGGCIGFIPEIYDGDAPHTRKGCPAQAWSMTEFLRVLLQLQKMDIFSER